MKNFTLFELNNLIRSTLDANLEPSYWVVAEIGEMRHNQKGHCYMEFVEKEDDAVIAKIRANIWAYTYRNLSGWFEAITGQTLHSGLKILANVSVQFHELYGMCLIVKDIDPNYTLGERAKKKQETIDRLVKDGVFDMNRELKLPLVPQRVAVISSPTAAGWGDFIDQLDKNSYGYRFDVRLFKSTMQGAEAGESLIGALHEIHAQMDAFDAVAIIRGGGAQVDLDCFDAYDLAAHVAQFPLPVITGIGHERDETIVDLVAHTRMKTPTAVSEFLISGARAFEEGLDALYRQIAGQAKEILNDRKYDLQDLGQKIRYLQFQQTNRLQNKLAIQADKLHACSLNRIHKLGNELNLLEKSIGYLDPENVLKRGYSLTAHNKKIVKDAGELKPGDLIETFLRKGVLQSEVKKITRNGGESDL